MATDKGWLSALRRAPGAAAVTKSLVRALPYGISCRAVPTNGLAGAHLAHSCDRTSVSSHPRRRRDRRDDRRPPCALLARRSGRRLPLRRA